MSAEITVGTRVAYRAAFLRSIGEFSGWMPFARGIVRNIAHMGPGYTIVTIDWTYGERGTPTQSKVNTNNLVREDRIHLEPR